MPRSLRPTAGACDPALTRSRHWSHSSLACPVSFDPSSPASKMVKFYIARHLVDRSKRFTLDPWQTCSFRHQIDLSGKHSSHAHITVCNSPTSIARYSIIQLIEPGRCGENKNAQALKHQQRGFKCRFSQLRVRHPTAELSRSTTDDNVI